MGICRLHNSSEIAQIVLFLLFFLRSFQCWILNIHISFSFLTVAEANFYIYIFFPINNNNLKTSNPMGITQIQYYSLTDFATEKHLENQNNKKSWLRAFSAFFFQIKHSFNSIFLFNKRFQKTLNLNLCFGLDLGPLGFIITVCCKWNLFNPNWH